MIIKIKRWNKSSLGFQSVCDALINKINQINETDFIIDFEGIIFISRSFAQAYYASKKRSPKNIDEINLSGEVKPMMEMVEKQLMF